MAFSLRKMLSNINYFGKPGDTDYEEARDAQKHLGETSEVIEFERTEPDSTSRYATSLKLPESVKNFAAKKSSLSDTDILNVPETPVSKKAKRKCKKLKVDVDAKISESQDTSDDTPSENTPKHMHLEIKSAEIFKGFDFNKSFDFGLSDYDSDNADIQSLSDHSDSDGSMTSRERVKMCRKVQPVQEEHMVRSTSNESFGDVELDKNEEERISLLTNYESKLEKIDGFMKKLLSDFQFNIEVSKIFHCRSVVPTGVANDQQPKLLNTNFADSRAPSPWDIIIEKEDIATKQKFRRQLQSVKHTIDEFVNCYLNESKEHKPFATNQKSKKRLRHFDFPDLRDAMLNLFNSEEQRETDQRDSSCVCSCHSQSETDSGVTSKSDERSLSNQSITSSIGNFSLDSSTLTAYSESLDQIVSYNSFQDTSLYSDLLQKPAIERITFYVQVHSVQLKCEPNEDFECKNVIRFYCPICKITETDENSLLCHILSQTHCEKIHFQYKTAYIKKCVAAGKEIQPSTVLNPMTMYRDVNKIVCFGDAVYACSLCFENLITGESILMAHIMESEHIERREKLDEIDLDSSTLTAYSESLDQIVSYNSFQDTSLYSDLLQKPAIERITFYVQVHSVQLKCEPNEDFECKNVIRFYCPICKITETDENSLLCHILSQTHCEKIHFQYKTAYIKKCVAAGKEIQPSTVLNPMTMYRDVNKIVCFGDAVYACSLCFENLITGESILMAHIMESEHIERREKLDEIE